MKREPFQGNINIRDVNWALFGNETGVLRKISYHLIIFLWNVLWRKVVFVTKNEIKPSDSRHDALWRLSMIGPHILLLYKKHLYGKFRESYTFSIEKMPAVRRLTSYNIVIIHSFALCIVSPFFILLLLECNER